MFSGSFLNYLRNQCFDGMWEMFHNSGAATENDLSPYALVLAIGVCKRFLADDLNIVLGA